MTFQIHALDYAPFARYFALDDAELASLGARRMTATESPGFPCRVSLADADRGDTLMLLNYAHLPETSPYRASHAIFVRENATPARPAPGEVPDALARRLLSVRGYGADHFMREADVVEGAALGEALERLFADAETVYVHIHNVRQGCFAAKATRAAG